MCSPDFFLLGCSYGWGGELLVDYKIVCWSDCREKLECGVGFWNDCLEQQLLP